MRNGVKAKDIRDFEKYVKKLNAVVNRVREYVPQAYLYVTPGEFNLMVDDPLKIKHIDHDKIIATSTSFEYMDCGDF